MPDFNKVLEPGDYLNGTVNTVIEIPKGSNLKIEWDRKRTCFTLDRIEPDIYPKPVNYGFIPMTIDEDGDELDTLVICEESLPTGIWLETKIIGVLNFRDDSEMDYKIICVPKDNRNSTSEINELADLDPRLIQKIEEHFKHYKDLKKPNSTEVLGWGSVSDAQKIITECIARYKDN